MIGKIGNNVNYYALGDSENKVNNNDNNSFSQILQNNLSQVNQLNKEADELAESFAIGETDNIHEVTIAAEKAQIAVNLTSAVQSQVMQAYEEIMRMQVQNLFDYFLREVLKWLNGSKNTYHK